MPIIALNQSLNEPLTHCTSRRYRRLRLAIRGTIPLRLVPGELGVCEFGVAGPLQSLSMKVGRRGFLYRLGFARAEINGEDKERFQVWRIMADAC